MELAVALELGVWLVLYRREHRPKSLTAAEAVTIMAAEMKRLGEEAVPVNELDTRKAALIGDFGRSTETTAGLANLVGDYVLDDVPRNQLSSFIASVSAVDPAAVTAAAKAVLDAARASIVIVGDAKQFIESLTAAYPQTEVIAEDALNLYSNGLK